MTLCRIIVILFAILWAAALALLAIGTFGWFGQEPDPLSGIFVVLLGSPWVQLAGKIGGESMILAILMPGLNLIILILICRLMGRRI